MTKQKLGKKLNKQLDDLLRRHHVTMSQPHAQSLLLNEVPTGAAFGQPSTNLLLRHESAGDHWKVFVDEDLRYTGNDLRRKGVFDGPRHRGWLQLTSKCEVRGDVNDALVWALNQLESVIRSVAPQELQEQFQLADGPLCENQPGKQSLDSFDQIDDRVVRRVQPSELEELTIEPTSAQADAIILAAESSLRPVAPNCPLLSGPSGVGKTTVARLAARELHRRGLVSAVLEVSGAAMCAGPIFLPERDERLRALLDSLGQIHDSVVILEQFDLLLSKSPVATSILADGLDNGAKIIGVARAEFPPARLQRCGPLQRRLELCLLHQPDQADVQEILRRRWAEHSFSEVGELSPNVLPLVNKYSWQRVGANPAAAIGLLEAVLNRAAFAGQRCVGPDDVFHLMHQSDDS